MSADTIGYQQMPKYNEDGHILCDAITRRYERLWFVVERQLITLLLRNHIRDSMHVSVVIPSTIILPLTASQKYNVFRIA